MHPIHPIVVHFPIALLCASVAFDILARRWPAGGFRDTSFYCLLAGALGAALAVVTGGMEEELAEWAGAPAGAGPCGFRYFDARAERS